MAYSRKPENGANGVLGKAIDLLWLIVREPRGIGVREAARRTGADKSAVNRILGQLERNGFVEQDSQRDVYRLGPSLYSLAAAVVERDELWMAAKPFVRDLVDLHDETGYFVAREGENSTIRGRINGTHRIGYVVRVGEVFPVTYGAGGMAVLAGMSEAESDDIVSRKFERYSDLSFNTPQEYSEELRRDRQRGYCVSVGRWYAEGAGVGSPVFNASGVPIGALVLVGPAYRMQGLDLDEVGRSVRDLARALSRRLGYLGAWQGWPSSGQGA